MAEGVYAPLGIVSHLIEVREHDARRPNRGGDQSRLHNPVADRAGRLIARAADNRRARLQPCVLGDQFADPARDLWRFDHAWQQAAVDAELVNQRVGPAAIDDVEQRRPRGVGDVAGELTGEAEPDIVLRQQDLPGPLVCRRLVVAHPQQLGGGEARQHRVGGLFEDHLGPGGVVDPIHLSLAALVAPDQRRSDDMVIGVEQHQPVHLAREADGGDIVRGDIRLAEHFANCLLGGLPPVLRTLLSPQRPRHVHLFMRGGDGVDDPPTRIHEQSA